MNTVHIVIREQLLGDRGAFVAILVLGSIRVC
jgi:hypothetical protein